MLEWEYYGAWYTGVVDWSKVRSDILAHWQRHTGQPVSSCSQNLLDKYIGYAKNGYWSKFGIYNTNNALKEVMENPKADRHTYIMDVLESYVDELSIDKCGVEHTEKGIGEGMDRESVHNKIITGDLSIDEYLPWGAQQDPVKKVIKWGIYGMAGLIILSVASITIAMLVKKAKKKKKKNSKK